AKHIILRPQQVSNHPEVIRRIGLVSSNGMIEADIYGNINSTNVGGSRIMDGTGGSGDFSRNGYITTFGSPSVATGGAFCAIVSCASHVGQTERDAVVVVAEAGVADLRGLAPRVRVARIIAVVHPEFRPMLEEFFNRAMEERFVHTPHDLATGFEFQR